MNNIGDNVRGVSFGDGWLFLERLQWTPLTGVLVAAAGFMLPAACEIFAECHPAAPESNLAPSAGESGTPRGRYFRQRGYRPHRSRCMLGYQLTHSGT